MPTKPIGIEDNETFAGRVGTALTAHARAAVPLANTPFTVRYNITTSAWEYTTLADAVAAGLDERQTCWFIGPTGTPAPGWARTNDLWTEV